jgi:hypothetical protein
VDEAGEEDAAEVRKMYGKNILVTTWLGRGGGECLLSSYVNNAK